MQTNKSIRFEQDQDVGMPKAPWIYISDPTQELMYGRQLSALIPKANYYSVQDVLRLPEYNATIVVIDRKSDGDIDEKIRRISVLKSVALRQGVKFFSVNVIDNFNQTPELEGLGSNHLNVAATSEAASSIYQWLFSSLSVRETLHLIPREQMMTPDDQLFPGYAYCPIRESSWAPSNTKIQFVALVLDKPRVQDAKKLVWRIADHTGVLNLFFKHRGPSSAFTWEWVLALNPGDRRSFPSMPIDQYMRIWNGVPIEESKGVLSDTSLFQAACHLIRGAGISIKAVGHGIYKSGKAISSSLSTKSLNGIDIETDKEKIICRKIDEKRLQTDWELQKRPEEAIDIFSCKSKRSRTDGASVASTGFGSELNEKVGAEFV